MSEEKELTLTEFGMEFQNKCITAILSDREFLDQIIDLISPDFFETSAQKWIVEKTIAYFLEHRVSPTTLVFVTELKAIDDQMKLLKQSVADLLTVVFGYVTDTDLKYVKNQFLVFCRHRSLATAIIKSVDLLKIGNYEEIRTTIDTALKAGMEKDLGHKYFEEFDFRLSDAARETIPTKWPLMDQLLDGGLGKGELGFLIGPAGSGKSWFLARIGAEAVKQGKSVVHITLELNQTYIGRRYDACFSGVAFQNLPKEIEFVRKKVLEVKESGGDILIKHFPMQATTAQTIRLFLDRYQMISNRKVDLLVVDYADLLIPQRQIKNSNTYLDGGNVYAELRGICGELALPTWSASQSNRGGHDAKEVGAGHVADSYKKIQLGDFIFSLSRTDIDKQESCGRIKVLKSRFGADGLLYPCKFNSSNGDIRLYDQKSPEGIQILKLSEDGEASVKKMTKGLWNEMMEASSENSKTYHLK